MGFFFCYPATCAICGWDGNENTVREHIRKDHPGLEERAKELNKLHNAGEMSLTEVEKTLVKEFRE